jgi:hypothetical protein
VYYWENKPKKMQIRWIIYDYYNTYRYCWWDPIFVFEGDEKRLGLNETSRYFSFTYDDLYEDIISCMQANDKSIEVNVQLLEAAWYRVKKKGKKFFWIF